MAKVTDLNTVQEFARQCIEDNGTQLLEFLTMDAAVNCFTMIYVTNDLMNGFAQDYENNSGGESGVYVAHATEPQALSANTAAEYIVRVMQ